MKNSADLSNRTKDMMAEMVQTAKDTTDRILHDADMSKAEKEEQIMRLNAWLTTELKDITGSERELGSELDAVEGESKTFDQEAEQRANKLMSMVSVKKSDNGFNGSISSTVCTTTPVFSPQSKEELENAVDECLKLS